MKSVNIQQVEGGYILATEDFKVKIFTNFGAVVKELRKEFDQEIKRGEAEQEVPAPAASDIN